MMKSQCSCSTLRQLTRKMTNIYDHYLAADELTISQYSLLARIGKYGPVGVIPLANNMGMDRSTMSRTLKPLIRAGWIETVDLPLEMLTDKRSFGVSLSTDGQRKWQQSMPNWRKAQDVINTILGDQTHQALMDLVDDANAKFEQNENAIL
ncbi:DNA-binding transcriptional regulator, MarR family [Collimonas sp. OK242]|jgi:DNA-binding MarR family transcriptional regulator|uniref:MarR family winged helix-turn-helix transcriptional regulator n=1 Tax=Collimonas sp. OK242 TaxID=1798195 RepID=UPI00089496F6|nr:MarR family transcriptional regulator [Collimonas sp. OK242]SDX64730.1 DNA-binding transcriptional regulator, MarR family [Collimonas sp. OK242]